MSNRTDSVPVRACTREEVAVLHLYRKAGREDKDRLRKAAVLALQNKLPSVEAIRAMSSAELRALVDSQEVSQ